MVWDKLCPTPQTKKNMSKATVRRNCPDCGQNRLFEKSAPNHVLHLILSVISIGFWIPIWILLVVANAFTPFRCPVCGKGKL